VSVADSARPVSTAFSSTLAKVAVQPGQESITAAWSYTNHWDFPLAVERFDSSCGCLAGSAPPPALAPGQSGALTATFTPGQHRGTLRKSLHVRFVGHDAPVELVLEARIPSSVELSAQEFHWESAASADARTLDVSSGTGRDFSITALLGLPERFFTIRQETVTQGTRYRLHITPTGAAAPGIHTLQVRTDSADPRDRAFAVFLCIP
jgi:hypothetical protein